ncbi:MAG: amino acid ABC transporter substrate-binding protein [Clostridia bacterium]|nr:amino acid ABC transporter substrate-binding protein [Clostridia bacterium]
MKSFKRNLLVVVCALISLLFICACSDSDKLKKQEREIDDLKEQLEELQDALEGNEKVDDEDFSSSENDEFSYIAEDTVSFENPVLDVPEETEETTVTTFEIVTEPILIPVEIPKKETLIMATEGFFPPYEYYEGDKLVGIDIEIAEAIADKLGMELEIRDINFGNIIAEVKSGKADFGMAGMTVTEERLEYVNFSVSYADGVQSIIVKEGSEIKSVEDLYADGANYVVGVQQATTGDFYSTADFGENNVKRFNNGNEAVLSLLKGDLDCVIIYNQPAKALVNEYNGLTILETAYADESYAICVAKENTELLENIDTAIIELECDGTIDAIISKYIY